jgi:hypothetical protein
MADRGFSNDELRLYELLQQFLALSDDTNVAGRVLFLGPTGAIVGDCTLAADDIEAATDALLKLNIQRTDGMDPAGAPLPEVDKEEVAAMLSALQDLADGGE